MPFAVEGSRRGLAVALCAGAALLGLSAVPTAYAAGTPTATADCGTTVQTSCSITNGGGAGTDQLTSSVDPSGSPVPGAGDAQAATSVTSIQQPAYDLITLTCRDPSVTQGASTVSRSSCVVPAGTYDPPGFDLLVQRADSAGVERPVPNALVHIAVSGLAGTVRTEPTTTLADGEASFIVTPTVTPHDGDELTATVVVGDGSSYVGTGSSSASVTVHYESPAQYAVRVTPGNQSARIGGTATVTAQVIDQFGDPVPSAPVSLAVSGRNTVTGPTLITDANGDVTYSYPDTGPAQTAGTDTVQATAPDATETTSPAVTVTWVHSTEPAQLTINLTRGATPACVTSGGVTTGTATVGTATAYVLCAEVRNAQGEALPGTTVAATTYGHVVADPVTGADGTAVVDLDSTTSGDQTISVTAGSLTQTATITYAAGPAVRVVLDPPGTIVAAGSTRRFTAYPLDEFGNPAYDATDRAADAIAFRVTGPGRFDGATTATAYPTATDPATVTLSVPAGATGGGAVSATLAVGGSSPYSSDYTIGTPPTESMVLGAPRSAVVRHVATVIAAVLDVDGNPIAGASVTFTTTGAQQVTGRAVSDASGVATFAFRTTAPGRVVVSAASGSSSAAGALTVAKQPVSITFGAYSAARGEVTLVALVSPPSGVVVGQRISFYQRSGSRYLGPIVAVVDDRGRAQVTVRRPSGGRYAFRAMLASTADVLGVTTADRTVAVR